MGHALHAVWATSGCRRSTACAALSMTVAETASNGQQALLRGHLMRGPRAADPDFELALLDEAFGNLHRYLFVMPTLVRFEREVHAAVGRGEALAAARPHSDRGAAVRRGLRARGDRRWDAEMASRVGIAWAEFPHLYEPFYTFQYTVGVAVALAQVARIDAGEPGRSPRTSTFLGPPVARCRRRALRPLGFDVTTPAPVEAAFDVVEGLVARLEAHAERMGR
jgi:oligoendopeptidase F